MNKITYILVCATIYVFTSCSDILNKVNLGAINDIWNDEALVETYVNNLYNDTPGWNYGNLDNSADEGRSIYAGAASNSVLLAGLVTPTNSPLDYWAYGYVRKCNELLEKIEFSEITNKKKVMAETRVLRAFQYFLMVMRYGGVPLITKPQKLDEDLFTPRSSSEECFDFIIKEFDEAAKAFEELGIITTTNGRLCKGSALGLKAKVQVYYASPLFNQENDLKRWENALKTLEEVMELDYSLYSDFANIHQHQNNKEIIFKKEYKRTTRTHFRHDYITPMSLSVGDVGYCMPLQELVDAFPMANGKRINELNSGYDSENPYEGRDKRFYATILYNGGFAYGRTQYTYVGYPTDGMGEERGTNTGYYCIKAINQELKDYNGGYGDETCFIFLRLADIYLMYAEARNELLNSPDESIYKVLDQIRQRAGCNPYKVSRNMTKEEMRRFIQDERWIEFAFEQIRYWDLRRWKLSEERIDGKKYHGIAIDKREDGSFDYSKIVEVDTKPGVFKDYMYLNPIPYSETIANPNMDQNPGY